MLPLDPTETQQTPAQTVSPDKQPDLKSQWDGFLQNPSNRAALLGFGIQALQGGWGGFGSQFGQALGAGVEAGGAVEAQRVAEEERTTDNARKDRALDQNMQIAQMNNQTRLQIGTGKGGAGSLREQQQWMTAYRTAMETIRKTYDPILTPEEDMPSAEDMEAMATSMADRALAGARAGVGNQTPQNAVGPLQAPSQGGSTGQGGTPPAANVGAPEPSPSNSQNQPSDQPAAPVVKNFKSKATGQWVPHALIGGKWVAIPTQ
jgi:hypothetical protein